MCTSKLFTFMWIQSQVCLLWIPVSPLFTTVANFCLDGDRALLVMQQKDEWKQKLEHTGTVKWAIIFYKWITNHFLNAGYLIVKTRVKRWNKLCALSQAFLWGLALFQQPETLLWNMQAQPNLHPVTLGLHLGSTKLVQSRALCHQQSRAAFKMGLPRARAVVKQRQWEVT